MYIDQADCYDQQMYREEIENEKIAAVSERLKTNGGFAVRINLYDPDDNQVTTLEYDTIESLYNDLKNIPNEIDGEIDNYVFEHGLHL